MEFTNNLNLPQYIVDWLLHDDYDHNNDPYTISATGLMKPIRATVLAQRHHEKLQHDASDLIASSLGNAIHKSIEVIQTENIKKEERLKSTIELGAVTYTITGKYDILEVHDDGTVSLRDIKSTSVWAYIMGGKDEEYRRQLSIYKWLLIKNGYKVRDTAYVDFVFTDWSSIKAKTEQNYPNTRIHAGYPVKLLDDNEVVEWIKGRLLLIEENKVKADEDLTPCTGTELWATKAQYAVMKSGAKRASKVCDTRAQAEQYIQIKGTKAFVEERPPKVKRCKYCTSFPFCNQGQSYKQKGLIAY